MPCSVQALKSSSPKPGEQWTIPVPVVSVTKSAPMTAKHPYGLNFFSKNGKRGSYWVPTSFSPLNVSRTLCFLMLAYLSVYFMRSFMEM
jgi:hypothetical protein